MQFKNPAVVPITAFIVVVLGCAIAIQTTAAVTPKPTVREVRWLLSHQPTDVFKNAVQVFAEELSKKTDGRLTLSVIEPRDIGVLNGDVPHATVLEVLSNGHAEIATDYTVALGFDDPNMWKLNLPFLFSGYEDALQKLDSPAAAQILAQTKGVRGLALTMSGGLRLIASKSGPIASLSDFKGKRILTAGGPIAEATLKAFGATPVPSDLAHAEAALDTSTIDGVEITYSRLGEVIGGSSAYTKYIGETNHSMFLTAILASNAFYDSLSLEDQAALRSAATKAAQIERQDSIELGNTVRDQLKKEGSVILKPTAKERNELEAASRTVYSQFFPKLTPGTF